MYLMSDKVKRYRDDNKYHASGAEHALSKFEFDYDVDKRN